MPESPVDLLRRAAEAAPEVLPATIGKLIANEIEHGGPDVRWWNDGDELGEHWHCLTCDEPMEPTEWRRGCECTGWLFAREVLALAEQQPQADDVVATVADALAEVRLQIGPNTRSLIADGHWKQMPLSLGERRTIAEVAVRAIQTSS